MARSGNWSIQIGERRFTIQSEQSRLYQVQSTHFKQGSKEQQFYPVLKEKIVFQSLLPSLARQVLHFYQLDKVVKFLPHKFTIDNMPKSKSNRKSPRLSTPSGKGKSNVSSQVSAQAAKKKETKTQVTKRLKQLRASKAKALQTQKELRELKKRHAEEEKRMEQLIAEAKHAVENPIEIHSDGDESSSSGSSSSDSELSQSAFAKRRSQRVSTRKKAATKNAQFEAHMDDVAKEAEKGDNEEEVSKNNSEEEDQTAAEEDDATVAKGNKKKLTQTTILKKRRHILYCKGKITVSQCEEEPCKKLRSVFMSFYTTLLKIDKTLLIFDYKNLKNTRYLSSPQQIPATPTSIQEFFDGKYRPNKAQQVIWVQLRIGIDVPEPSNFFIDAKCLFDDKKKHALFLKDLQVPETETIGYFLYSNGKQSRERLAECYNALLPSYYKNNNKVSVRWQKISTRLTSGKYQSKNDELDSKAYHIEVAVGAGASVTKAISHMYSSTRNNRPYNELMRYVPYPQYAQNSTVRIQYKELRKKQAFFMKRTTFATTYDITELDDTYEGLSCTLREFLMDKKHSTGYQLLNSVDFSYDGKCVMFIYPRAYEEEAQNFIADLPSYALFKFGQRFMEKYFTPEAYERAEESPWNEELKRAESKISAEFDHILKESDELPWMQFEDQDEKLPAEKEKTEVQKPALFNRPPNDDASLDTFGVHTNTSSQKRSVTPEKDNTAARSAKKARVIGSDIVMDPVIDVDGEDLTDDEIEDDEGTVATLSSRLDNMETNFQNMESNLAATIQAQFAKFFKQAQTQTPGAGMTSKLPQPTVVEQGTQDQETSPTVVGGGNS